MKPPANLGATFNTLTSAASRAEADLNAIVAAAETHDETPAAEQASASLVTDIESAKAASTTITP